MNENLVPKIALNDGVEIPAVGFGTYLIDDSVAKEAVLSALEVGYRLIDTAEMYGNERGVGAGIRESGLARSEVFVTSKLQNHLHDYDDALSGFEQTMTDLDVEYVDLFLIHWPLPRNGKYVDAWRALDEIVRSNRCRSIGVSNFQPEHLDRLTEVSDVVPSVNQIEVHPYFQQEDVRAQNAQRGIVTQAWSPIDRGDVAADHVLTSIAAPHGKTAAQVTLRWHLQRGDIAIPKSMNPARMAENFDIFDFELSEQDMERIGGVDRGGRRGPHPNEFHPA